MSWNLRFEDPVRLPDGRIITTLREAGNYIAGLPKKQQRLPHWEVATEALLMAAEGRGPVMHAHIGLMRALNATAAVRRRTAGSPRPPSPAR